jgi:hypothetical protein
MLPLNDIHKPLREHVSSHVVGLLVEEVDVVRPKPLIQPRNRNTVRPTEMTHDSILPGSADLDHGLVILMELQNNLSTKQPIPQLQPRHTLSTKSNVGSNNFCLRRAM